jgi:valyl-tRNA synthetase
VFVHGLVRAGDGQKMSKSLGNGVDPIEIIDQYGADALRFMLINGSAAGNDMRFTADKLESARNFANKLWNASRFTIMNLGDGGVREVKPVSAYEAGLEPVDLWMLKKTRDAAADITRNLEAFDLSVATQKIYELIWNEYCDWYIEFAKLRLAGEDEGAKAVARSVLVSVLSDLLRLLHPFMPFITEEIWSFLGKDGKLICDRWVDFGGGDLGAAAVDGGGAGSSAGVGVGSDAGSSAGVGVGSGGGGGAVSGISAQSAYECTEFVIAVIRAVRNIRAEAGAGQSRRLSLVAKIPLASGTGGQRQVGGRDCGEVLGAFAGYIEKLAGVKSVQCVTDGGEVPAEAMSAIVDGVELYIPLDDLLDYAAERERLAKEKDRLEGNIARLSAKLSNEGFTAKAPEHIVGAEREKLAAEQDAYEKTLARIEAIQGK